LLANPGVEVRYHAVPLYNATYRFDDLMLVTPYLYRLHGYQRGHLDRGSSGIGTGSEARRLLPEESRVTGAISIVPKPGRRRPDDAQERGQREPAAHRGSRCLLGRTARLLGLRRAFEDRERARLPADWRLVHAGGRF
jgi:hypothetical protein